MWKFEKQFRESEPQTIGETDKHFDLDNYKDWLETKINEQAEMINKLHLLLEEHQPSFYLLGHHREIVDLLSKTKI